MIMFEFTAAIDNFDFLDNTIEFLRCGLLLSDTAAE